MEITDKNMSPAEIKLSKLRVLRFAAYVQTFV